MVMGRRGPCSIEGCPKITNWGYLCTRHYGRKLRHGDPTYVKVIQGDDLGRFESKVDRSAGPDACHPWLPGGDHHGYGKATLRGKQRQAHRVAWELANECPPPVGHHIDHECHNEAVRRGECQAGKCPHRLCCNPAHLVDRAAADHVHATGPIPHPRGSDTHNAKLCEAQVAEIKQALRARVSQRALAQQYGVAIPTIGSISSGRTWRHVA